MLAAVCTAFGGPEVVVLRQLCETGAYRPAIDSRFPLSRITEAHVCANSGRKSGSVVVTLG